MAIKNIDVIVLCGGLGTRFRNVIPNRPKILAPIGSSTCLDILAKEFFFYGFRNAEYK